MKSPQVVIALLLVLLIGMTTRADETANRKTQVEFFESRIRPVLVEHCYECHNSVDSAEGNLKVDFRDGLIKGGDSGPAINKRKPNESLLLKVVRHEVDGVEMPDGGPKLSKKVIADFEQWVQNGAIDPRDRPPSSAELAQVTSWEEKLKKRKQWWSFQPLSQPSVPTVKNANWSDHPVDRFILARLEQSGLEPSPQADRRTLIRRLSFALTGLPPTPEEIHRFEADVSANAFDSLVTHYLESPAYGEHWARHWMDLVRYTESHGSEGDPAIPHAYRYRDYLIRALNQDVPFDRLVREHIAGDLLPDPRINAELGINESVIGTAHWRMVFHGFAPTDALDEKVRFTDDQINVFSKAFMGLTVSCARCHDHKFDAISQKDFYALFGILASTRPAILDANTEKRQALHKVELMELKKKIKTRIADLWLKEAKSLTVEKILNDKSWQAAIQAADKPDNPLHVLHRMHKLKEAPEKLQAEWRRFSKDSKSKLARWETDAVGLGFTKNLLHAGDGYLKNWHAVGNGSHHRLEGKGGFTLANSGTKIVADVLPHGLYSHLLSTKHGGMLMSSNIRLEEDSELWVLVAGDQQAMVRYAVHNYPRRGTVYPVTTLSGGKWKWQKYNLDYWTGEDIHVELTTAADSPVLAKNNERSWFGIRMAFITPKGTISPPPVEKVFEWYLINSAEKKTIAGIRDIAECYRQMTVDAAVRWKMNKLDEADSPLLDSLVAADLLPNGIGPDDELDELVARYRKLESEIPEPYRVPGLAEGPVIDQPLFVRGDHRQPSDAVPRRFLEAIDTTPYKSNNSGRLQLANDLFRPDNPLSARVAVNRIWHYLFGEGLVRTPDNFGRLGEQPTHPQLLDDLANRMITSGWSTKDMIRFLVTSKTWQLSSHTSDAAAATDPANRLLSHAHLRRLEAESIRDALLMTSGQLDRRMFGPSVGANNQSTRRSVFLTVRRNSLDRFLSTFNAPVPFATVGRRNNTNVPAQSLTLLNDPFVIGIANRSATSLLKEPALQSDEDRITVVYERTLGRNPTTDDVTRSRAFLGWLRENYAKAEKRQQQLAEQQTHLQKQLASLVNPIKAKILESRNIAPQANATGPEPTARWTFDKDGHDSIGTLHTSSRGKTKFVDGAVVLDGTNFLSTGALPFDLHEKTLQATVSLSDFDQRGGGVMTVQDMQGNTFDSIVFGEKQPKQWLSGSNHFRRTQDFGGKNEAEANVSPVEITIVYDKDGSIRCYRNGQPYGKSYQSSGPMKFVAGQSQIVFGLRHGTSASGNRMLRGKLHEARLYARALSAEEVAASFRRDGSFVSQRELLAKMTADQRTQWDKLNHDIARIRNQQQSNTNNPGEQQVWADFVHAVFNVKEFIYLR